MIQAPAEGRNKSALRGFVWIHKKQKIKSTQKREEPKSSKQLPTYIASE